MPNFSILNNYFTITLRVLQREKIYAMINILGLALAVACCLILALYVRSELTFDQHNEYHKDIVRVTVDFTSEGETKRWALNSLALAPLFKKKYPDIGEFVRFTSEPRMLLRNKETELYWNDVTFVDKNVFNLFSHTAIYGELENALQDRSSIAISESFSKNYFGDRNPIGETLSTHGRDFIVSVVFNDLPDNSHLNYSALLSMDLYYEMSGYTIGAETPKHLFSVSGYIYFKLPHQLDQTNFRKLLDDFSSQDMAEAGKEFGMKGKYRTQKMADVHFQNGLIGDRPTGNVFYLYSFISIGIFVLLVACTNYTNLAIARTTKRSIEVGMRKVIGAERYQLIGQYISESFLYVLLALILGLVFVEIIESQTSIVNLMGKEMLFDLAAEPELLLWVAGGGVIIAVLAGLYPALYLSSIQPISAVNAAKSAQGSGLKIREVLIFLQFFVSITVLSCSLIMQQQMQYVASKPLGFDNENTIAVMLQGVDVISKVQLIKTELLTNSNINGVAVSTYNLGYNLRLSSMEIENNNGQLNNHSIHNITVDKDYISVMGTKVVEGVDFSDDFSAKILSPVVVNEMLVRNMGWEEPIGKRISINSLEGRVIGVTENFHFLSLHEAIEPFVFFYLDKIDVSLVEPNLKDHVNLRMYININSENIRQSIAHINNVMTKFDKKSPFEFKFVDDLLGNYYLNDNKVMKLSSIFSAVFLFISCMGLYGLTSFATEQRTKEIGIRKVLGASTFQIISMLTKKMIQMVLIAAVFGSVISFLIMDSFLASFAYRIEITFLMFVLASSLVAFVAVLTVIIQSFRAAQSNPINALKYE